MRPFYFDEESSWLSVSVLHCGDDGDDGDDDGDDGV